MDGKKYFLKVKNENPKQKQFQELNKKSFYHAYKVIAKVRKMSPRATKTSTDMTNQKVIFSIQIPWKKNDNLFWKPYFQ